MADKPINLNKARKARARAEARARADENAVRFGQSKRQKAQRDAQGAARISRLDGHRRDDDG
ncbi:MAG: DUF4169 family protein [Rhodobacteraceae bacterium]|nr:DUF4169 family protein [Paracoccaceae bacterium]